MRCDELAAMMGATGRRSLTQEESRGIDAELDQLLLRIAKADDFSSAKPAMTELAEVQTSMATLAFKYKIELTPRQAEFVRDFDRWHSGQSHEDSYDDIRRQVFPYVVGREK